MSLTTTMTSKGQLTIPKAVRDELKLSTGTRYDVHVVDGDIVLSPRRKSIADLAGMLGNPLGRALTQAEMDEAIGQHLGEEDDRIKREWHEGRDDRR